MRKYVKPKAGAKIRMIKNGLVAGHLPPEGADVVWSQYWIRRLRSGDVVLAEKKRHNAVMEKNLKGED